MLKELRLLLLRDLDALRREIELYPDDESVWREVPGFSNTGGSLVLHLAGNLRHFIGAQLGGGDYLRDRAAEFALRGLSRERLIEGITAARAEVSAALSSLDPARLKGDFPIEVGGHTLNCGLFLLHLRVPAYHPGRSTRWRGDCWRGRGTMPIRDIAVGDQG
jgi:hypothetical protein